MNKPVPAVDDARQATLLIVDDEPANLALLSGVLQPYYRVRAVRSGQQALRAADSQPRPDLMLLDIMMPELDGYQVLRAWRDDPQTRAIPVIFITACSSGEEERRGLELGAVDYISKPIDAAIVLARVATHVALKQARDRLREHNADLEAEVRRRQKENEQIQLQFVQSEKMAAIGQLAAGVVHEINNPIGYVRSNLSSLADYQRQMVELLGAYRALDEAQMSAVAGVAAIRAREQEVDLAFLMQDSRQLIDESLSGLERVRGIVRDLKDFSRQSKGEWEWADLHAGLDSTLNIVWNQLKYHCRLHKEYGDLPLVPCMPNQLNQVFLNLLVNASQAIEAKGDIYLRTGTDGEQVWVEIADTGGGIAPEHLTRVFEPFFTTKPKGQGTGLGLSLSYRIVERHGGRIEVASELGKGTRFRVWAPLQPPDSQADNPTMRNNSDEKAREHEQGDHPDC